MKPVKGSIVDRNEGLSDIIESGTLVIHMGLYSTLTQVSDREQKKLGREKAWEWRDPWPSALAAMRLQKKPWPSPTRPELPYSRTSAAKIIKNVKEADRPDSVHRSCNRRDSHSSRHRITPALKLPTRTLREPHQRVPIWNCSGWRLPRFTVTEYARLCGPIPRLTADGR